MKKNGSVTRYIYSAAGEKLRVTHLTAVPNITVPIGSVRELLPSEVLSADSTDYLLGGSLTLRNGRVDKLQFEEGYCQATAYSGNASQDDITFQYYDRDHLGNVRQVIKASGSNKGPVLQTMDYYPFGAQFCPSSTASDVQQRKYNGKEFDNMHGLNTYDYGARQYNPVTTRWDRVDPLCEKYYAISPYAYCGNNPVMLVDPDGRDILIYYKDNYGKNYTYRFDGTTKEAPNNQYVQDFLSAYYYNKNNGGGEMLQKAALDRDVDIYVMEYKKNKYDYIRKPVVLWNSRLGNRIDGGFQSPATGLEHEMDHAYDDAKNPGKHNERVKKKDSQFENAEEKRVITGSERKTAEANGEAVRNNHKGTYYVTISPISTKPYKK